jgi:hypothetical protein
MLPIFAHSSLPLTVKKAFSERSLIKIHLIGINGLNNSEAEQTNNIMTGKG